jgi:hypothetical protein
VVLQYEGDDCLIWPYANNRYGYGQMVYEGRHREVHRVVCELVNGDPPTPLHVACHYCNNGDLGCVAPTHVRWATRADNMADRKRGRARLTLKG